MAKKTIEKFYSDLSGDEIDNATATLEFGFDGTSYEIDLTPAEREKLANALAPYLDVARKKSNRRKTASKASTGYDAKAVRAWALENKIDVPARGRIPASVIEAYRAAE